MSFADLSRDLAHSFKQTGKLLQQLLAELQSRRASWVSRRPSLLQPSEAVEQLSLQIAAAEDARNLLLQAIRRHLPTPIGVDEADLHVNVTRIADALPREAGQALRAAALETQSLARRVRTEVTLGQRLLRFARDAEDSLAAGGGAATPQRKSGYDRSARPVRSGSTSGQLVDGRI
jgi:hypothetical protein